MVGGQQKDYFVTPAQCAAHAQALEKTPSVWRSQGQASPARYSFGGQKKQIHPQSPYHPKGNRT